MSENPGSGTSPIGGGDNPGHMARDMRDQVQHAGSRVSEHAQDVAQDAKRRGMSLAGDMKDQVASAADDRKDDMADRLEDVAKAMHRSGEQLEGHQDWMAGVVERGAAELRSLASTLRTNDLQSLLGSLDDLARRQPAVFVGASMAAGFAMVRLGRIAVAHTSREDLPSVGPEVGPHGGSSGGPKVGEATNERQ